MTFYSASISADTIRCLHHGMTATRQPPRPRVMSAFAPPVDPVEIATLTTIYPPLTKRQLTPCCSQQKRAWGEEESCPHRGTIHPGSDSHNNEYACRFPARKQVRARTDSSLATAQPHGEPPRGFSRCTTPFHSRQPRAQQRCSGENSLPTWDIKGQDNRGRPPTVILFFSENARLLHRCEKDTPTSKAPRGTSASVINY